MWRWAKREGVVVTATVRPWTCCEPIDTRFTVLPSSVNHPPSTAPPSAFAPLWPSSDPSWRGTIKPQGAFREDPVTRAPALSSALTKSATEREETRALRETLVVVHTVSTRDRYLDILPPCLSTCPASPPEYFSFVFSRPHPKLFTPISPIPSLSDVARTSQRFPSSIRFLPC